MRPLIDRVAANRRAEHNERPLFWFVQPMELETWNKEREEKRNGKNRWRLPFEMHASRRGRVVLKAESIVLLRSYDPCAPSRSVQGLTLVR